MSRRNFKINWKKRFIKITGAFFILAGLAAVVYFFVLPWATFYLNQRELQRAYIEEFSNIPEDVDSFERVVIKEWQPMKIVIPKIDVELMVQEGDVFDTNLLRGGPVHFSNVTSRITGEMLIEGDFPSTEGGNVAISGHRTWDMFRDVDQLEEGDEIYILMGGYRFIYHVERLGIIASSDWSDIRRTDYPAVTIQTCEPKYGPATARYIVRGRLHEVTKAPRPDL